MLKSTILSGQQENGENKIREADASALYKSANYHQFINLPFYFMLKAHLFSPWLFSLGSDRGYYISIAIAYYDNGQWISEGWKSLKPNSTEVLLNQSLKQRYYYFYIKQNMGMLALDTGIGLTRVHYYLSHKYSIGSNAFWLGDGHFKKNNARYSGGGFSRFIDNVFNGGQWIRDWYLVDVGNASDYTIHFELERHSSTHYHYPHH